MGTRSGPARSSSTARAEGLHRRGKLSPMSDAGPASPPPDRNPVQQESDVAFPRLDEAQMATMVAAGRREEVEAGHVLFSPGDLDYELILVVSGCVEVVDEAGTSEERVLVAYGPRQFAGELDLITAEPA